MQLANHKVRKNGNKTKTHLHHFNNSLLISEICAFVILNHITTINTQYLNYKHLNSIQFKSKLNSSNFKSLYTSSHSSLQSSIINDQYLPSKTYS